MGAGSVCCGVGAGSVCCGVGAGSVCCGVGAGSVCCTFNILSLGRCSMALLHSRIQRVFYGVPDPLAGGLGSKFLIHCQKGLNHHFEVYSHVEYAKCQNVTSSEKNAV